MKSSATLLCSLLSFTAATLVPHAVQAATNGFFNPAFRGSGSSEFGYWETFTTAVGAPGNLAGAAATTGAVLTQSDTNAFLTGSGNIYSFASATVFKLTDTTPFTLGSVLLQTRSVAVELDYASVRLSFSDGTGPHLLAPVLSGELDRSSTPAGTGVSRYWQWDLTSLGVNTYALSFQASGPSMSFDAMTLDTANSFAAVPEASSIALGAAGIAIMMFARLRKKVAL